MEPLVLYDGTCGLCHRTVRWLLAHESTKLSLFHGRTRRAGSADAVVEVVEDRGGDLQPVTA